MMHRPEDRPGIPTSLAPSRRQALRGMLALTLVAAGRGARAADYPDRPVKIIVPFTPGGGVDIVSRVLAQGMAPALGQTVLVDNRPGAGTIIGSEAVAKSPPDGYTLVTASFAHAVNPSIQARMPFDTEKAFAPVILIGRSPNILVVPKASPIRDVAELLRRARAKPGEVTYGSFGNATSSHLAAALFCHLAKVEMTHIPYRGSAPAVTDLLAGRIDTLFATSTGVSQQIRDGQLRAIAVTSAERSPAFPDLPSIAEAGVPGYAAESWYGLYVPAGTPAAVIDRLNAAANAAVRTEAFQRSVAEEGLRIVGGPPAALADYVRAEAARWAEVVRAADIKAE
jgi:tripartite-type tricarboxylate transporter receptor subunit TctC